MRVISIITLGCLLLCLQAAVAQDKQISREFTKTYRAYNTAYAQGNYPRAAELAQKALNLAIAELGDDHEKIPVLQVNLAHVLLITGKIKEAEPILLQAKSRIIEQSGSDDLNLITVHEDHAKIYISKKETDKARQELDKIINIISKQSSDTDPAIANVLMQKAAIDIAEKKLIKAEAGYRQALAIYDEQYGEGNMASANVISLLGDIDISREAFEKAELKYLEALRIYQDNLLEDDPVVLASHARLARLYVGLRDDKFAHHADQVIKFSADKDGPAYPMYVMRPRYPVFKDGERPQGWALVEFTVTADGRVEGAKIIESNPGNVFDKVSLDVTPTWRFKPKVVDGERIAQQKTRVRLVYMKDNIEVYFGELKL